MEFNFSEPTRQSYVAILLIIQRFYKTMIKQFWPLVLVFFLGGGFSDKKEIIIAIAIIGALVMIYGIISFFNYYFFVNESELIVKKGVIKKTKTTIPFDRIQSIDFEQNLIHRIFNVVKLNIDTAGSQRNELKLQALNFEKAKSFRRLVFDNQSPASHNILEEEAQELFATPKAEKILTVGIPELLKIGISANHFRSAAVIVFFLFWVYENLEDIGFDPESYLEEIPSSSVLMQSIALIIVLIILFVILSFIISLIRTILQYFDLSFIRQDGKFKVMSGLFNRKETAALDNKIQIIDWSQNVLQKWFNLYELRMRQASSVETKLKSAIRIPGIKMHQIQTVKEYLFEDLTPSFDHVFKTHKSYFIRYTLYISFFGIMILTGLFFMGALKLFLLASFIIIYQITALYLRARKYRISYNENYIKLEEGSFGDKTSLLALYKIQNVQIKQSIYQRRKQLADILVQTAGGNITIPYLQLEDARKICNYCLYKVESSSKAWM